MTRSTGKRAKQCRREELWDGEIRLRRALLHVMSASSWAILMRNESESRAQGDAYALLMERYLAIVKEQAAL